MELEIIIRADGLAPVTWSLRLASCDCPQIRRRDPEPGVSQQPGVQVNTENKMGEIRTPAKTAMTLIVARPVQWHKNCHCHALSSHLSFSGSECFKWFAVSNIEFLNCVDDSVFEVGYIKCALFPFLFWWLSSYTITLGESCYLMFMTCALPWHVAGTLITNHHAMHFWCLFRGKIEMKNVNVFDPQDPHQ